jgi:ribulose-5-phosphate 4-epimerase/fuculose-1-phosphate aldolase
VAYLIEQFLSNAQIKEFIDAGKYIDEKYLVRGSSGNLSYRNGEDGVAITRTGAWLGKLTEQDISYLDPEKGNSKHVDLPKPSSEHLLHLMTLRCRPEMNVVLHFQSPYLTAISCRNLPIQEINTYINIIPEIPYYLGVIGVIPFYMGFPGSEELASNVANTFFTPSINAIILENHGGVVLGKTLDDAIQKALFLELAAQTVILNNMNVSIIGTEHRNKLINMSSC